jgi:hypothetical protein
LSGETVPELFDVQAYFGLPSPTLVEENLYVVKALAAIVAIDTRAAAEVFGGGTALSRAHRLIQRMSEDIDWRILGDRPPGRGALRRLSDAITRALLSVGFKFDPKDPAYRKSGNENRYTIYRLPYVPAATEEAALRPTDRHRRSTTGQPPIAEIFTDRSAQPVSAIRRASHALVGVAGEALVVGQSFFTM